MSKKQRQQYLETYLELQSEEIEKLKKQIDYLKKEKEETIETIGDIKTKICEVKNDKTHTESLNSLIDAFSDDIFRLSIEIEANTELLDDLELNYKKVIEELEMLKKQISL